MSARTVQDVIQVLKYRIVPLLQEYFYDDWEKIALILGGVGRHEKDACIIYKTIITPAEVFPFGYGDVSLEPVVRYHVKPGISAEDLKRIYETDHYGG